MNTPSGAGDLSMTEDEWTRSPNPHRMLQYVDGSVSDRKLRLFACACCRRIWDLIEDDRHRRAVDLAERFADGSGRGIEWEKGEGNGWYLRFRKMTRGPEDGPEAAERASLLRELEEACDALPEEESLRLYHQITPEATAVWTLELRCDVLWAVADSASRLRAASSAYWKRGFFEPPSEEHDPDLWSRRRREEM